MAEWLGVSLLVLVELTLVALLSRMIVAMQRVEVVLRAMSSGVPVTEVEMPAVTHNGHTSGVQLTEDDELWSRQPQRPDSP